MCCGKKWNGNEPLGMPQGSNTAIFGYIIIIICTFTGSGVTFYLLIKGDIPSALGVFSSLSALGSMVVTYYFQQKSNDKATKEIINAHTVSREREARAHIETRDILLQNFQGFQSEGSLDRGLGKKKRLKKDLKKSSSINIIPPLIIGDDAV